jgi:tRNA (cytidine/uridine-2'-O-)-methyltransferase
VFNIVLVNPQIPPNTGTIGRLCVNLDATLHLVRPLGFDIDDKAVRRAGLDYWHNLKLVVWESFEEFLKAHPVDEHTHLATTKTDRLYFNAVFEKDDYILFGSETKGIDEKVLLDNPSRCITIPMGSAGRSLNLGVSVGIVTYEALRQNYEGFEKITIANTMQTVDTVEEER